MHARPTVAALVTVLVAAPLALHAQTRKPAQPDVASANRQGLTLMGPRRIYNGELCSLGMLFAQQSGCIRLRKDLCFEIQPRRQAEIGVGRPREAIDAAVLAAAIGIDRAVE